MTVGEVDRAGKGINFRRQVDRKERASFDYAQALLLGKLFGITMGSKESVPSIEDVYPELFDKQESVQQVSINRFKAFASAFNARFKKQGGE